MVEKLTSILEVGVWTVVHGLEVRGLAVLLPVADQWLGVERILVHFAFVLSEEEEEEEEGGKKCWNFNKQITYYNLKISQT